LLKESKFTAFLDDQAVRPFSLFQKIAQTGLKDVSRTENHLALKKLIGNTRQTLSLKFSPKKFFKNKFSKASGYFFTRFLIGDMLAQQLSEIKTYRTLKEDFRASLRAKLVNLYRTSSTLKLFKFDVEAKGRSTFVYYPQKKS
jgi:hypothetical protein